LSPSQISFTLANTLLLPGFIESPSIDNDVVALSNNTTAQNLRNSNYADIVILLTANVYPGVAGVTRGISTSSQNAYCISEISPAATTFTGTHEIGHIIGARHQRCTVCFAGGCDFAPTTNHGFTVGTTSGTIMYQQACGRVRIGVWSNEFGSVVGLGPTGNALNDNTKKLRRRADNVACFRAEPPPFAPGDLTNVDVEGPVEICAGSGFGFYSVTFNIFQGVAPYSYLWQISADGISGWTTVGTSSTLPLINSGSLPNPFFIRCTVTDYAGKTGSDMMTVSIKACLDDGSDDREYLGSDLFTNGISVVAPNPFKSNLSILPSNESISFELYSMNGLLMRKGVFERDLGKIEMDVSSLHEGTYILRIIGKHSTSLHKVVKQ
jgi:Metallo-peptidase family M12/Secretion system C-terminal sorting domain